MLPACFMADGQLRILSRPLNGNRVDQEDPEHRRRVVVHECHDVGRSRRGGLRWATVWTASSGRVLASLDGGSGITHQTACHLTEFEIARVGAAAPQWSDPQRRSDATVVFTVQPVGWTGDWHENPAPQWIVVLSGRWWIESMDGTRIEQGPGEFSLSEESGSILTGGRKGHRSGTGRLRTGGAHDGAVARSSLRTACHFK